MHKLLIIAHWIFTKWTHVPIAPRPRNISLEAYPLLLLNHCPRQGNQNLHVEYTKLNMPVCEFSLNAIDSAYCFVPGYFCSALYLWVPSIASYAFSSLWVFHCMNIFHHLFMILEEVISRTWLQVDLQPGLMQSEAPHPLHCPWNVCSTCLPCANRCPRV